MRWWVGLFAIAVVIFAVSSGSSPGRFADRNPYLQPKDTNAIDFFMMRWFGDDVWADQVAELAVQPELVAQQTVNLGALLAPGPQPQITWLGHATFLLQYRGLNILTDPIFSDRASPLSFAGPERLQAPPTQIAELPSIDYVVISHNHYDHLDTATIRALGSDVIYLVPLGLTPWFTELGIPATKVREFDWWDERSFGTLRVTATPSQHWSARSLWDKNDTLWASWHLAIGDWQVWFAGDTGYNDKQFKEIGQRFPKIDDALLPIGAYLPRWFMQPQHINPEEALRMHRDAGAQRSYAMHWGTYQLAAESLNQTRADLDAAKQKLGANSTTVQLMAIGETLSISH
ncbi:MBL fold metallo-hydrolase [Pseudidiomarina atlantica]|uniref:MBL fold metallo-hydrolase n=1 Tax=Pseudidiomarina atlantica TaxID=1517416 RepID=UPI00068D3D59|nr:MBL fold metallo-hydrolase [Pseudidiomarina atlantica]